PLADTLEGFDRLREQGKIRDWGVSNFDVSDMQELFSLPGGKACAANQVLYNPEHRGVEFDLLPWCERNGVGVMAYSPVGQGGDLLQAPVLLQIARKYGVTTAQVALAWCLRQPVQAIPKAGSIAHVEENAAAVQLKLEDEDLQKIETAFPGPKKKVHLATL
ncbi:MAG: aldo/keto reductase, partial [Terriglobus roseus]|nr:aldo/keto reductase [Terriglobus roseus]